jgi:hypothetical protein
MRMVSPSSKVDDVRVLFQEFRGLFAGKYPGYRASNTRYHDLTHTTDTTLAMARLLHGVTLGGAQLSEHGVYLGVVSALLHDTGYIQTLDDTQGTGAKYTREHIERSIEFTRRDFQARGFPERDAAMVGEILRCTGLDVQIEQIQFMSEETRLLGHCLGTADLLGQVADRRYLERLVFLYEEFREAGIEGYETEWDMLTKTPGFITMSRRRCAEELGGVDKSMIRHFRARWGIDRDMYQEDIDANMAFLSKVILNHRNDYRKWMRRKGIYRDL